MSANKVKVRRCRLCLTLIEKQFYVLDEITGEAIDVLLLKLNLEISENPVICEECLEHISKSVDFKSVSADTEELITSFANDRQIANFDIKDMYGDNKDNEIDIKYISMCRFCMNPVKINDYVSLDVLTEDLTFKNMLFEYMSDMDFNIIKNPIVCSPCRDNLESYFKFIRNCLDIEHKINTYYQVKGYGDRSQLNLCKVRFHFFSKGNLSSSSIFDDSENVHSEAYSGLTNINEEYFIKDEADNFVLDTHQRLPETQSDRYSDSYKLIDKGTELDMMPLKTQKNTDECHSEIEAHKSMTGDTRQNKSLNSDRAKKYKCRICTFKAKRLYALRNHMKIHGDILNAKKGSNIDKCTLIKGDISKGKMYECPLCHYKTKTKADFNNHMMGQKDVSEIKMHKCALCPYQARLKRYLRRHVLVHQDVSVLNMHKCSLCSYQAKVKIELIRHMVVHKDASEVEMFKCSLCPYEARRKGNLRCHVLVHKNISEIEMYKCALCPYETKRKSSLKNHMIVHKDISETGIYNCSVCAYETYQKYCLKSHMNVHKDTSKRGMYKCYLCAYETERLRDLVRHMLVHKDISEIKMHKCSLCSYMFKDKRNRDRHMLIHKDISEIKMYKCSLCSHQTKLNYNLKKHMLIHKDFSEIKVYKCSLCDYKAKQKGSLNTHNRLVHTDISEIQMYRCASCDYKSKWKGCLKTHILGKFHKAKHPNV